MGGTPTLRTDKARSKLKHQKNMLFLEAFCARNFSLTILQSLAILSMGCVSFQLENVKESHLPSLQAGKNFIISISRNNFQGGQLNRKTLMVLVFPLVSCLLSSVVGIVLGQIGNFILAVLGESAICLAIPGLFALFVLTFGLSFICNRLITKLFQKSSN
jgi:hypothetical protein